MKALEQAGTLVRHAFHGDWNYTLRAKPGDTPETDQTNSARALTSSSLIWRFSSAMMPTAARAAIFRCRHRV